MHHESMNDGCGGIFHQFLFCETHVAEQIARDKDENSDARADGGHRNS